MKNIIYILILYFLSSPTIASSNFLITFSKQKIILPAQNKLTGLCNTLAANKPSGIYQFNINGSQFSTYCDMTHAGGGWTLVGKYIYSTTKNPPTNNLDPLTTGHISSLNLWNLLSQEKKPIVLISYDPNFKTYSEIDYHSIADNSICEPFTQGNPHYFSTYQSILFFSEQNGCTASVNDYTMINLSSQFNSQIYISNYPNSVNFFYTVGNFWNYNSNLGTTPVIYVYIK